MSQFYFALVSDAESTFQASHKREDAGLSRFVISQREGNFALLEITLKNPRVGLLNDEREQWAWLAWDDGSETYPLFFGRLMAVPDDMHREALTLIFRARPSDYEATKEALAETLKVAPYWDPVWVRPEDRSDPDIVLEARTQLYHTDRVTHAVTVSDSITGEAGTIDLTSVAHDGVSIHPGTTPLRKVTVEATAFWDQEADGSVDISKAVVDAFAAESSGDSWTIHSLTGQGLTARWFEEGRRIGSGWAVGATDLTRADGVFADTEDAQTVLSTSSVASFPVWKMKPELTVTYDTARSRSERLSLTVTADVQAIIAEPGGEDEVTITVSGPVDEEIDGSTAIGDLRRRAYFPTDRGRQSIEYLICLGRAEALNAARAVEITAQCKWQPSLLALTCRHNARLADPRIPGGEATGKVIGYTIACEDGRMTVSVSIGCMVGQGNTVTATVGDPTYVEDGYVEEGYHDRDSEFIMPIAGEIVYSSAYQQIAPDDDGIDFVHGMAPANVVEAIEIAGALPEQREVIADEWGSLSEALTALNQVHTTICIDMVPLNTGPFETEYPLGNLSLMVPKTIDLEAGSSA